MSCSLFVCGPLDGSLVASLPCGSFADCVDWVVASAGSQVVWAPGVGPGSPVVAWGFDPAGLWSPLWVVALAGVAS